MKRYRLPAALRHNPFQALKRIPIIPTLCTLGNAVCGFMALLYATQAAAFGATEAEGMYRAGMLIFAAMVFDVFDGYLARRTKMASQFGAELDSLCDGISFGAVPGFLLIRLCQHFEHHLIRDTILLIAVLYMTCALLRLARFNVQATLDAKSHRAFRGLPSPAAAGCVAALVAARFPSAPLGLVPDALFEAAAPLAALAVALLMVSRVPYPHIANRLLHRRRSFGQLMQLILVLFLIVLFRELALVLAFWGYALMGPVRIVLLRGKNAPADEPPPAAPADHPTT